MVLKEHFPTLLRRVTALTVSTAFILMLTVLPTSAISVSHAAPLACGDTQRVTIPGASAYWTKCSLSGGKWRVYGQVTDTAFDARCAKVDADFKGYGIRTALNCRGVGKSLNFDWTERATSVSVFLSVVHE